MKKAFAMFAVVAAMACPLTALAAPETMPDGTVFDAEYYAQTNPDVVAAVGADAGALYQHYAQFGKKEGRLPYADGAVADPGAATGAVITLPDGTVFDPVFYAQTYPDIAAALGTDAQLLAQHYMQCGKAEGRLPAAGTANAVVPGEAAAPAVDPAAALMTYRGLIVTGDNPAYTEIINSARALLNAPEVVIPNITSEDIVDGIACNDGNVVRVSVVYSNLNNTDPNAEHYPYHVEGIIDGNQFSRYCMYGPEMARLEAAQNAAIANIIAKNQDFQGMVAYVLDPSDRFVLVYSDLIGLVNIVSESDISNLKTGNAVMVHVIRMATEADNAGRDVDAQIIATLTQVQ